MDKGNGGDKFVLRFNIIKTPQIKTEDTRNYHSYISRIKKIDENFNLERNQNPEKNIVKNTLPLDNKDFWWIVGRYLGADWLRIDERQGFKNRHGMKICCNKNNDEQHHIREKIEKIFPSYSFSGFFILCLLDFNSLKYLAVPK